MAPSASLLLLLPLISLFSLIFTAAVSQSTIQLPTAASHHQDGAVAYDDKVFCDSWRLSVETNNAGDLASNKPLRCRQYVEDYMTGIGIQADSDMLAYAALAYAKTVDIAGDGKDAWVFDLDETLLTNLPYFRDYEFGYKTVNLTVYYEWVEMAVAPAFPASLKLYNELKELGFALIIISGRGEGQRSATERNLVNAGFTGWDRLLFGEKADKGLQMRELKSKKRLQLVKEGYRLHANYSHQWCSLVGEAMATKSFKFPNPMYYVP
ncbi:unnamed protein product [Linum tenue]|uniref:Acid phosphatase 1 n=1 Tax=Linum tenue TaxID=586396 RepID=A0AAV0S5V5_9ROSI|nr:unnamed protein product [Linum tenue]